MDDNRKDKQHPALKLDFIINHSPSNNCESDIKSNTTELMDNHDPIKFGFNIKDTVSLENPNINEALNIDEQNPISSNIPINQKVEIVPTSSLDLIHEVDSNGEYECTENCYYSPSDKIQHLVSTLNNPDELETSFLSITNSTNNYFSKTIKASTASDDDLKNTLENSRPRSPSNYKYNISKPKNSENGNKRAHPESSSSEEIETGPNSNENEEYRCKWSSCSSIFDTFDEIILHVSNHVGGRTYDRCHWNNCNETKSGSEELLNHLYGDHLGIKRVKLTCLWQDCNTKYSSFNELTAHISEGHIGSGRSEYVCNWYKCERNGRPFSQRQKVMRHLQSHTGDKPYICNLCEKRFAQPNVMTLHFRTHTGEKPYKCSKPDCTKAFSIPWALNYHLKTHDGEKPFSCKYEDCNKQFSNSSNLSKHERTHTGEKPFNCQVDPNCPKRFARLDHAKRHTKVHLNRGAGSTIYSDAQSQSK